MVGPSALATSNAELPARWAGLSKLLDLWSEILKIAQLRKARFGLLHLHTVVEIDFFSSLLGLDDALAKLSEQDPIKAKLIELRFFGGLTVEQSCEALGISRATANRYWNYARAWLFLQVSENGENSR